MSFVQRKGWFCQFLEPDLQTALLRKLSFSDVEKVRQLAKRGGGFRDLESAAALEHGIETGRRGVWLSLTAPQYTRLKMKEMTATRRPSATGNGRPTRRLRANPSSYSRPQDLLAGTEGYRD